MSEHHDRTIGFDRKVGQHFRKTDPCLSLHRRCQPACKAHCPPTLYDHAGERADGRYARVATVQRRLQSISFRGVNCRPRRAWLVDWHPGLPRLSRRAAFPAPPGGTPWHTCCLRTAPSAATPRRQELVSFGFVEPTGAPPAFVIRGSGVRIPQPANPTSIRAPLSATTG
jgi:hypothetical protein